MEVIKDFFYFIADVKTIVQVGGLLALVLIIFAETGLLIGFFLPGDSLLVTAGIFCASHQMFDIFTLNISLIIAAIIGDATGYFIGKKTGKKLYHRENSRFFKKEYLIKTKIFYEKYGGITIILARFIPFARTFAPVVAGIAEMKYTKFAVYNILGGILWVVSMTFTGYFLAKLIPNIETHIHIVIVIVVFVSVLPGIIKFIQEKNKKKN